MASIHLEGILVDSVGEIDVGGVITFTHLTTTGGTIASTQTELIIPPDGAYSIDVEYGQIRIDYTTRYTENFIANVIVNSDSTATSIPELLSATTPVTEPIIIEMQGLVADAVTAEAGAVAAADRAESYERYANATWEDNAGYTDTEIVNRLYPAGNVLRYGADPTGVVDSTAAFNLATRGNGYSGTGIFDVDSFAGTVVVPAGYFKISSAVWVHKGQHLKGEGEGGTNVLLDSAVNYQGSIFRLGKSSVQVEYPAGSGLFVDKGDAGGLPPEISGIWTFGGPASYPVIETSAAGASIHNMFLTACGTGIKIDGGDIRVNNIQIDICATGLVVGGRSNTITNVLIYVPNIAIATTMADGDTSRYLDDPSTLVGCSDIVFSNIQIFATKFYSTHLRQSNTVNIGSLGADVTIPVEHSDISFNNFKCQQNQFASNGYENFNSFILTECNEARNVVWSNCSFNNMNGPAMRHSTGISNDFRFNSCTFDGRKTLGNFNQALTPSVCTTLNDRIEFNNCTFKNLKDITNEVTLTAGGAVVGTFDPYEQLIVGPIPKIPFDAGIHTITYTGSPTHTAIFAQGSSSATEVLITGGTVSNCLTPTATESVLVRIGDTPSPSDISVISERDVNYEDVSMSLCNIPTVSFWHLNSDKYLNLSGVGVTSFEKVGGSNSNYRVDTTAGVSSIALPRIDANPKRDPKNGDILTFIDAEDTWATNNVTFLAGDNFIDGGTSDFVASGNGSEVAFVYVADTNLAASPPKGNWISRVVPKSSLPLTGGTVTGSLSLVDSAFRVTNDAGVANPSFTRAQDAAGGMAFAFNRSRGTIAAPTTLVDGDIVAGVASLGYDGTGYQFTAGLRTKVSGAVSAGVVPQKLVLETGETNGQVERMVVMPDGKIGIGTSAPTVDLDVVGDVNFSGDISKNGTSIFNEFGGLLSGQYIAQGYALTSTFGAILLPINSDTAPTSVTIVGGFDVVRFSSNVLAAGVSLTLNTAISSNRLAILLFETTGLVEGTSFSLMTQTNASKITVNF